MQGHTRAAVAVSGWDYHLRTFIYPGFICGSSTEYSAITRLLSAPLLKVSLLGESTESPLGHVDHHVAPGRRLQCPLRGSNETCQKRPSGKKMPAERVVMLLRVGATGQPSIKHMFKQTKPNVNWTGVQMFLHLIFPCELSP